MSYFIDNEERFIDQMKKLIKLLMGIAILSLFCTCGKKRQVKIEGKVYNPITQEGISGAEIRSVNATRFSYDGSLEKGTYIIMIQTIDNKIYHKKIIIL